MTDTPDFPALLASITRCNAVYETDDAVARAAFAGLGCAVLGRISDAEHQAVASIPADGIPTLTISGTRVSEGSTSDTLGDLWQDVDFTPVNVGGGAIVASGAHARASIYAWMLALHPGPWRIEGHSLGGQTTHVAPLFVPLDSLHSMIAWEPPKAGNALFYEAYAPWFLRCTTIVHGRDPWAAWPWTSAALVHPAPLLWLQKDSWSVGGWPGAGLPLRWADHDTDQVMLAVRALVAA